MMPKILKSFLIFLGILIGMTNGQRCCSQNSSTAYNGTSLGDLWKEGKKMMETTASKEFKNLHKIFFTTIHEYENSLKTKEKNSSLCLEFSKDIVLRALVLALRNNENCLQNQIMSYANSIDSKIRTSQLENEFPDCYRKNDLPQDIVKCLDLTVKETKIIKTYKNVIDFFEHYNDKVVISMNECITNFTIILNESLAYTKNEFNACKRNQKDKKMDILKNSDYSMNRNLTDIYFYYIEAIESVKTSHEYTLTEYKDKTVNYYGKLVSALGDIGINSTCCYTSQRMYLQDRARRTRDETYKCLNNHSAILEYFGNSTLQAEKLELFTKSCYKNSTSPREILLCIDEITLKDTETVKRIYRNIKINLQRHIELDILHKSNCLNTVEKKLEDAIDLAIFHLNRCIEYQRAQAHCKPYRFIDENYKGISYGDQ